MSEIGVMGALPLLMGVVVGFSLGLTGGGGSIFAVPLLVYGMAMGAREAVGVSLASVGATSLIGALDGWRRERLETRTGLIFAAAGVVGAPLGTWIAGRLPEALLLTLFASLMLLVAGRMWWTAASGRSVDAPSQAAACRRDASGALHINSRCAMLLMAVGLATGVLSGLFGVGGGFVIVPALVMFSGMDVRRAIATSLMAIALISAAGVAAHAWAGGQLPLGVTAIFAVGGVAGMFAGAALGRRISGPALQKVFAAAMIAVAAFVMFQNTR